MYNFLLLGWTNLLEWDRLGTVSMGSSPPGRAVGAVEDSKLNMNQRCSPAGASCWEDGEKMELGSTQHSTLGGWETTSMSWNKGGSDKKETFFSLSDQPESHPGRGAGCPERLCSLCLWSFQDPNGRSTEQPGQTHSWPSNRRLDQRPPHGSLQHKLFHVVILLS